MLFSLAEIKIIQSNHEVFESIKYQNRAINTRKILSFLISTNQN